MKGSIDEPESVIRSDKKTSGSLEGFIPIDGQGILFPDELTSAPQMTQAGCYQLVLDRKLGEHRLLVGKRFLSDLMSLHGQFQKRRPPALTIDGPNS